MSIRIGLVAGLLLLYGVHSQGQTTVQYDSGNTAVVQDLTPLGLGGTGLAGNYFTGLGASQAVSAITVFLASVQGGHQYRLQDNLTVVTPALHTGIHGSPVNGFNTITFAPVAFNGTDVFVGFRDYSGFAIAIDSVTNGMGSHAYAVATGGSTSALTGNFVLRITGPTGLPAELINFSVE